MSDTIERLNAALEGRYQVEREIGEGGMATVFLAKDLKHNRNVALKVLKPELAAVVGAERFLAEIKTTANLQHPHILPLFDSGEADSFLFYVMPYVEGETLRDRLDKDHQLPVDDAVQIATNVAEALDYAHSQGVIHRDIKPANILLQAGKPVISDFGIALAVGTAGQGRLTETGLSMGTPHYMSPEQATGDMSVGAASDTYALGCVLYEMLVGEPPYTGRTAQAILGKIIAGKVASATEARVSVPANVDAAIRKALEKLPADRFVDSSDFARAMAEPSFRHRETEADAAPASLTGTWRGVAAGIALGALIASGLWYAVARSDDTAPSTLLPTIGFGDDHVPGGNFHLGPADMGVVYEVASGQHFRSWGARDGVLLEGFGVVSPDGRTVGSLVEDEVRVMTLPDMTTRTILRGYEGGRYAGSLDALGNIYVAPPISRISIDHGTVERITAFAEGETDHRQPFALPGGRTVLFAAFKDRLPSDAWVVGSGRIYAVDIESGERTFLVDGQYPLYSPTGHLIYLDPDRRLMAASFDASTLELGAAVQIATSSSPTPPRLSTDGRFAYWEGYDGNRAQMMWVTRNGEVTPVDSAWSIDHGGANAGWSLSPGDSMIAWRQGIGDIWVKDLTTGTERQLTFDRAVDKMPRWSPDGAEVVFLSERLGKMDLWSRRADGTGEAELLLQYSTALGEGLWSPDREWLIGRTRAFGAGVDSHDIIGLRLGDGSQEARMLVHSEPPELFAFPEVSPDGRWMAYQGVQGGENTVWVVPFPETDSGGPWRVGVTGTNPKWSTSTNELFFFDPTTREMVAARYEAGAGFRVLRVDPLFTVPPDYETTTGRHFYDVADDNQRFLMVRNTPEVPRLIIRDNFFEELKRLVSN